MMFSAGKKRNAKGAAWKGAPIILVSNDDGVHAEGIRCLARALKVLGRVVVVAPDQPRNAASHSITLHRPLRVESLSSDVFAIDGTPTDCMTLGIHEILKRRPDLIVSGINHGGNLGDDVHYSGTVSAAYEGGILGIPSIAVSLVTSGGRDFRFAARFATRIARKVLREGLPRGVILNVNIPDLPKGRIKGYAFTRQGKKNYGEVIVEKIDPRGKKYYWIGGKDPVFENIRKSDCNAIKQGFISITPLRVDITDHRALKMFESWKL